MSTQTYLILAHTDPAHLARLVRRLGPQAHYVVHVDRKARLADFETALKGLEVAFTPQRMDIRWGGWSMVEASQQLIRTACSQGFHEDSSHFVLLSGACYPIKPVHTIREFLASTSGRQHIQWIDVRDSPEHYLKSVKGRFFLDRFPSAGGLIGKRNALLRKGSILGSHLFPKPLRNDFTYGFGSQWWALTPDCAKFCVDDSETTIHAANILRSSWAPDELYFHTVVANSPFSQASGGKRPYEGRGTYRTANLHLIDPSLSKVFALDDFDTLATVDQLFVRKVSTAVSGPLLDRIDSELLHIVEPAR